MSDPTSVGAIGASAAEKPHHKGGHHHKSDADDAKGAKAAGSAGATTPGAQTQLAGGPTASGVNTTDVTSLSPAAQQLMNQGQTQS